MRGGRGGTLAPTRRGLATAPITTRSWRCPRWFLGASLPHLGNGPDCMAEAVAGKSGLPLPSYFGYPAGSLAALLPVLRLVPLLFL